MADHPQALKYAVTANQQNSVASFWFWVTVPTGIAVSLISLHYFHNAKHSMYLGIKEYNQAAAHADLGAAAYFGGMSFQLR